MSAVSKTCHFSNIRCFLKPIFTLKNCNAIFKAMVEDFLTLLIFDSN